MAVNDIWNEEDGLGIITIEKINNAFNIKIYISHRGSKFTPLEKRKDEYSKLIISTDNNGFIFEEQSDI